MPVDIDHLPETSRLLKAASPELLYRYTGGELSTPDNRVDRGEKIGLGKEKLFGSNHLRVDAARVSQIRRSRCFVPVWAVISRKCDGCSLFRIWDKGYSSGAVLVDMNENVSQ